MTRSYNKRPSIPFPKLEAYEKALTKLGALQEECERPENRYYCPCISVADSRQTAEDIREDYKRFLSHLYPDGPDKPPRPIDPKNVTPNEIFYRMLVHDGTDPDTLELDSALNETDEITDGYRRWTPPALPRTRTAIDHLTKRIHREIAKLEQRRDRGYGAAATPCDVCLVTTPEKDIPVSGILGVTSYLCEMARMQTPEGIEKSNAALKVDAMPREDIWALKAPEES